MSGKIDKVLNVSDLRVPQSIFLITKTLEKVKPGSLLQVVSREKTLLENMSGEYGNRSYGIVEVEEKQGVVYLTIVKKMDA